MQKEIMQIVQEAKQKAQNGIINQCAYCGEYIGNSVKLCPNCRTQAGRKKIFDENAKILKENEKKGFKIPLTLRSWK